MEKGIMVGMLIGMAIMGLVVALSFLFTGRKKKK